MAFGINRAELRKWKQQIDKGGIAFLTHFWVDERFPGTKTVTKVGCSDLAELADWGKKYGLRPEWIHGRTDGYSHFDLIGPREREILLAEGLQPQLDRLYKEDREDAR